MKASQLTGYFILIIIGLIGVYDGYALLSEGTTATVSYKIRVWSKEYPAFTFLMGFTMGHLFWGMRTTPEMEKLKKELEQYKNGK